MADVAQRRGDPRVLAARPVRQAVFLSDMHLHGGDPAGVARAVRRVRAARAAGADAVFVLGDAFLAWLGPASLHDEGLRPFLDELAGAVAAGVRVVLFHGNHDFLLGRDVEQALGVEVAGAALDVTLGGLRARLLHGDALCTRDVSYHRLHRVLRARAFRAGFLALPLAARVAVRDRLLAAASRGTAAKPQEVMAMVDERVQQELATGPDVLVAGHVHRARDAVLPAGGRLVVLGDFESTGSHATFRDGRLTLAARDARYQHAPGPVVAIDGPAGCGKSSVARALARRLGFGRLDSGAVYRAVTARVLAAGLQPGSPAIARLAQGLLLEVEQDGRVIVDGLPVPEDVLRGRAVSEAVSPVSADPALRQELLVVQRAAARRFRGLVADGRDMATVVFPEALVSVYLDARPEVRAHRRWEELRGTGTTLGEVRAQLERRDERDRGRATAPLAVAEGACVLDTSDLTLDQVVDLLLALVRAALERRGGVG
jgi:cytidylate kinase